MICKGNTSACDGRDLRTVKLPLRSIVVQMCAACREVAVGMGLHITVVEEERPSGPRWLARLQARDETGRLVA